MQRRFRFGSSSPHRNVPIAGAVGLVADEGERGLLGSGPWPATPGSRLTFARKLLMSSVGIGLLGAVAGSSFQNTSSTFTASATNSGSSFGSGTLTMTNSQASGCARVIASACGILNPSAAGTVASVDVGAGVKDMFPGNYATGTVSITNAGTLPAAVYVRFAATPTGQPGSNSTACGGTCASSGLSSILNFTLHDDSSSIGTSNRCLYGTAVSGGSGGACDDLTGASAVVESQVDPLQSALGSDVQIIGSRSDQRWAAGETHVFKVTVQLPHTSTDNTFQGGSATFDVIWSASQ